MFSNKEIETFRRINEPTVASHHYIWDILTRLLHLGTQEIEPLANAELIALSAFVFAVVYQTLIKLSQAGKYLGTSMGIEQ